MAGAIAKASIHSSSAMQRPTTNWIVNARNSPWLSQRLGYSIRKLLRLIRGRSLLRRRNFGRRRQSPDVEQFDIEEVNSQEKLLTVKILLEEYWNSLGFNHQTFGFGDELDGLPGAFARPLGRLAMAILSGRAVACVAMRPLDVNSCEMKRLFVRPSARGHGVAQKLLGWLVSEARSEGYSRMLADP